MDTYLQKRNFDRTPEPRDFKLKNAPSEVFLVQEHAARAHHYDFRIEIDGKLKSWAIPKGPSLDPRQKRMAILTEDHPLAYYHFEGTIPLGEYGAGKVIIWDRGKYQNMRDSSMAKSFREGKIELFLQGEKLKGRFALIRANRRSAKPKTNFWLLIKMKDEYADETIDITTSQPQSVKSHKTISTI